MKKLLLFPIFVFMMSFSQCDKDSFDKKSPINFDKIYYQDWVGGRPGSSGTLLVIIGKKPVEEMVFDSIYFNKKVVKIESQLANNELTLTANFIKQTPKDRDLILAADPKEEFGNKPSVKEIKTPFELAKDEAIISYTIKGKKRYFKIQNIKKEKTLYYP